jgi:hypothetical protein
MISDNESNEGTTITGEQLVILRPDLIPPPEATKTASMRGLGDLVAKIADPIANVIGLNKATCGCQKRQDWLNQAVPFGQHQDSAR